MDVSSQLALIAKGTHEILPGPAALQEKLERAAREKRPLRVKLGIDPSGTDIHVGHTVTLWKLRQLQDMGHQAVLIVGDFTAMLGDPSGRNSVRPQLTHEQVLANAESYQRQISRIVDLSKAEVVRNGDWFARFGLADVIRLGATTTLARMLERKDFKERFETQRPLYIHELLYPLMQGWDSVEVRADIEIGGTDQVFNILKGRELMEMQGQSAQVGLITPLLLGTDGVLKMGKSTGNYIGLNESSEDMYGKVMSIPDELILHYTELAVPSTPAEVDGVRTGLASGALSPMDAKLGLARRITTQYHGAEAADRAVEHFQRVVRDKSAPEEMPALTIGGPTTVLALVHSTGSLPSRGECRRLIEQGGVRLDEVVLRDPMAEITPQPGAVLRVGKRHYFRLAPP